MLSLSIQYNIYILNLHILPHPQFWAFETHVSVYILLKSIIERRFVVN